MKKLLLTIVSSTVLFGLASCENVTFGKNSSSSNYISSNDISSISDNVSNSSTNNIKVDGYLLKAAKPRYEVDYHIYTGEEYKSFSDKVKDFSANLTSKIYNSLDKSVQQNDCISPVSIYMALAMAAECADNNTRQELLNALGLTYEEISTYTTYLYSLLNREFTSEDDNFQKIVVGEEILKNSIWIDELVELKETGLNSLADKYHTDSYHVPFFTDNKLANNLLRKYVYDNTKGLIDSDFKLGVETLFALVNTFYLKDIWSSFGDELQYAKGNYDFVNNDGSITNTQLLQGYYYEGQLYEEESFSHFYTQTQGGFKLKFIVPKDNYTLDDVFTYENIIKVNNMRNYNAIDDINMIQHNTRVIFPEFEASFDEDIAGVLKEDFNIKDLFDIDSCDMSNVTDADLYCASVIHQTKLKVDKVGIEGAAVTIVQMAGESGPIYENVFHDFVIDRAFGFVLTDNFNIPLFSGVVEVI